MTRRFSTYMQILERENIDGLKKSIKNDFTYHLNEWGERQQGFRQPGAGEASAHVDSVEQQHKEKKDFMTKCKSQGGSTKDCMSQYRDFLTAQTADTQTETSPEVSTSQPPAPQPKVPQPEVAQPQAPSPEVSTLKDPPVPEPNAKPSLADKIIGGANKFGQAMDRATDRIDTFHQRSGAGNRPGSLGKVLQYGLMGQEGVTQNQVRRNVYDNMISQGYTPEQAKQAADQAARNSTRQQGVNTNNPRISNTSQQSTSGSKSGARPVGGSTTTSGATPVNNKRVNNIVSKLQQSGIKPSDPRFKSLVDSETNGDQQLAVSVVNALLAQQSK